jgi:uncharacterized membrane protein
MVHSSDAVDENHRPYLRIIEAVLVPTMTEWGMIIFMVLAGLAAGYYLRKRGMIN